MTDTSWLGKDRYASLKVDEPVADVRVRHFRGALRNIRFISPVRLERAKGCHVEALPQGGYAVFDQVPDARLRDEPHELEYVHLADPQIDRCHCRDFLFRGEAKGTPCKHILAVLLHEQNPQLLAWMDEQRTRDAVAAAAEKPAGAY